MLRRLGFTVALLMLLPGAARAQQASVGVYARVIEQVETQRLVAASAADATASRGRMPASWRWEARGAAAGHAVWSGALLASGQGGEGWQPAMVAREPGVGSYLFAPI